MEESNKFTADDSADSSSESVLTDEWQELCKSDYAKVIFCYLYYDAASGNVECKFQITDNVHEDPCDFVGLYRIGYDNLSQCLASKLLSETKCEDDGKLQHCIFNLSTLPLLEDGFYQFLYVTRDKEVCGASMPFEITRIQNQSREELSDDDVIAEKTDDDFLLVCHGIERKNRLLEDLLDKYRRKNQSLTFELEELRDSKDKISKDKEDIIASLNEQILSWKSENLRIESQMSDKINTIKKLTEEIEDLKKNYNKLQQKNEKLELNLNKNCGDLFKLHKELKQYKDISVEQVLPDKHDFFEQLEDQLCMIKALEDSKQLALKEMSDLSETLSKRTHFLYVTKSELEQCKNMLKDADLTIAKQNEDIKKLHKEVNDLMQALGEKEDDLTTKNLKIQALEKKLQNEQNQSKAETKGIGNLDSDAASTVNQITEKAMNKYSSLSGTNEKLETMTEENVLWRKQCLFREASIKIYELRPLIIDMFEVTDFSDSAESALFYQLKIELLILLSDMRRSIDGSKTNQLTVGGEKNLLDKSKTAPSIHPQALAWAALLTGIESDVAALKKKVASCSTKKLQSTNENCSRNNTGLEEARGESNSNIFANALSGSNGNNDISSLQDSKANEKGKSDGTLQENSDETVHGNSHEDLKKVPEIFLSKTENVSENIPNIQLQIMTEFNTVGIDNLDSDDVATVNQMTESVLNKYSSLSETNEKFLAEDSSSDTDYEYDSNDESDIVENPRRKKSKVYSLRKKLLCIERILMALKDHLYTTNDWSHLIAGYNMEYAALPPKQQINLLLDKCKTRYQISVLMHHFEKQKEDLKKMSRRTCDLLSQCMMLLNNEMKLKSNFSAKEAELTKLKEENVKNNADIDYLSAEKLNLLSKEANLQETVKEYAARITEAAEVYKRQFMLIEKLKKKLKKYKLNTMVSSRAVNISEKRSSFALSFETQKSQSQRNISDSDTGEHVSASGQNSNKRCEVLKPLGARPKTNVYRTNAFGPSNTSSSQQSANTDAESLNSETITCEASEDVSSEASSSIEVQDGTNIQESIVNSEGGEVPKCSNEDQNAEELHTIPCILCDKEIWITAKTTVNLLDHLEKEHQINICPICGQLFEPVVPKRYLNYHIEDHFRS